MIIFAIFVFSNFTSDIDSLWGALNRVSTNVGFSAIKVNLDPVSSGMGGISYPEIAKSPLLNPALVPEEQKCVFSHTLKII